MVLDDYDTEHTIKFEKIYNVCANDYLKDVAIMFAKEQLQDYEMEFQNVHIDNLIDDFMTTVSNIQNSFNILENRHVTCVSARIVVKFPNPQEYQRHYDIYECAPSPKWNLVNVWRAARRF